MDFGICFKGDLDIRRTIRLAQQAEEGGLHTFGRSTLMFCGERHSLCWP